LKRIEEDSLLYLSLEDLCFAIIIVGPTQLRYIVVLVRTMVIWKQHPSAASMRNGFTHGCFRDRKIFLAWCAYNLLDFFCYAQISFCTTSESVFKLLA
jgi:hypothetical protein